MNEVTFEKFIDLVSTYNKEDVPKVTKAYEMAKEYHAGQKRESGEDYIIHPLNVAYILASMHADSDTVCAGLLHDTLEDTKLTKEEIKEAFNSDVASLVDDVTKISTNRDKDYAYVRKLITSMKYDIRAIVIKLADCLHNTRTLKFKSQDKQIKKSIDNKEIYIPIAYAIGAYKIRRELEDLSFMYLEPSLYYEIKEKKESIENENRELLIEVLNKIKAILEMKNIPNEILIRTKSVLGVYKYISQGKDIASLHDLLALKIIVDTIDNCYLTLGACHSLYIPINERLKDYIPNPKTTMYRAIHTTVFANEKQVQFRIRSFDLDKIGSYGLMAYWDIYKDNAKKVMQDDLRHNFRFYESLRQIDNMVSDNKEFVNQVKNDVFSEKVYICSSNGEVIELPKGSNIIDYAYYFDPNLANKMIKAYVNGEEVPLDYVLSNKDIVNIVTSEFVLGPDISWEKLAQTGYARQMVKKNRVNKTTD